MSKLLFPTDFSEAANHAFRYASEFANAVEASITVLHIYSKPDLHRVNLSHTIAALQEDIVLENFENFRDQVPGLKKIAEDSGLGNISLDFALIDSNNIPSAINKFAETHKMDFIIMGTTGSSGLKDVFMGSNAAKVISQGDFPTISVPVGAKLDNKIDNIAFLTNFHNSEKAALDLSKNLANKLGANIMAIHTDESHTSDLMNSMNDGIEKWKREIFDDEIPVEIIDTNSSIESIGKIGQQKKIDLVVVAPRERGFFGRLFSKSFTLDLVKHQNVPVLSIPPNSLK